MCLPHSRNISIRSFIVAFHWKTNWELFVAVLSSLWYCTIVYCCPTVHPFNGMSQNIYCNDPILLLCHISVNSGEIIRLSILAFNQKYHTYITHSLLINSSCQTKTVSITFSYDDDSYVLFFDRNTRGTMTCKMKYKYDSISFGVITGII